MNKHEDGGKDRKASQKMHHENLVRLCHCSSQAKCAYQQKRLRPAGAHGQEKKT